MPIQGFSTVDLGYERGDYIANIVTKSSDYNFTKTYFELFQQVWVDDERMEDITTQVIEYISTVYKENSPEFIYFVILYNIFNEFLEDINEDLLPNEATGFKETEIWNRLYSFQKDAVIGIINKLQKYNGCILADSVELGKTGLPIGKTIQTIYYIKIDLIMMFFIILIYHEIVDIPMALIWEDLIGAIMIW